MKRNTWICDKCGQEITGASEGYVIWKSDSENRDYGFRIIHQGECDDQVSEMSSALSDFVGEHGVQNLLSFLSVGKIRLESGQAPRLGVKDLDEFVDFFRRVQTSNYEEARRYFRYSEVKDAYNDANEFVPYLPEELDHIITLGRER